MRIAIIAAVVVVLLAAAGLAGFFLGGGGGGGSAGPAGAAAFRMGFTTATDHMLGGISIYMRAIDANGATLHGADATTDGQGFAVFRGVPANAVELQFSNEEHGRCNWLGDLGGFVGTEPKPLGTCVF